MKKWVYAISTIVLAAFVWLMPSETVVHAEGTSTVSEGDAATGESFESAISFELGEEVDITKTSYYKIEITEPGEYILETNTKQSNYSVHIAEGAPVIYSQIKNGSFYYATYEPIEYSGDVIEFETPGTYYIVMYLMKSEQNAGSFSLQKADVTSMVLDCDVSTELITEHLGFYKFAPEQTGRYSLTSNATGDYELHCMGYWNSEAVGEKVYVNLEAGNTYYFCLKSNEKISCTAKIEKIPEIVEMEINPPKNKVLYKGLQSGSYGNVCGCKVTLEDGSEEVVYHVDTYYLPREKYAILCKYYTIEGEMVSPWSGLSAGKYYVEFVAGDITSEPVYFEVKDKEDCELVLKPGETLELEVNGIVNNNTRHLVKLVLNEAGSYVVKGGDVYDENENYVPGRDYDGTNAHLIDVNEPTVYYILAPDNDEYRVSCTKLYPLESMEVSKEYRKNYINALADNALYNVLNQLEFKALFEDGKNTELVCFDNNWRIYELSYTLYNSKDKENPITETTDLPIGDYIIQISDADGKVYCEVDFSVISPKDVSNALKVGETVKLTGEYENYYLELTEADSLYVEYGEGTAVNPQIRIYSSDLETNYKTLSTTNKKELEAGKYFVRVWNRAYPDSCTFTIKGNLTDAPTTSDNVETQLDSIMDLVATAEEKVSKIIETLKLDELCKAMQQKISILVQISDLEKQYIADKKIEVTEPEVTTKKMDKHKIKTVGAGLNTDKGKVTLSVTDATQKVEIPADKYHNTVALDIKLKVNDVTMSLLKIPVTITMPIPAELMEEDLVILHYASDGSVAEVIYPTINGEDKTFSFAVTHFSTFVLANEKDGADNDTDVNAEEADTDEEDADEGVASASEKRLISPKTGEPDMTGYMVMFVLSLVALMFCMKKIRE